MAPPKTLPANFDKWDAPAGAAPPATLPADFSGWDTAPSSGAGGSWSPETTGQKVWRVANTPLVPPGRAESEGRAIAASGPTLKEAEFGQRHPTLGPLLAGAKRGVAGAYADTAELARQSTTPFSLATVGAGKLLGEVAEAVLPSATRAGATAQRVMALTKNRPVTVSGPGNVALEIDKMAQSGGAMPKVIRDFLKRTTDPEKGALTYEEARRFYQNATRLSVDEMQRLTPNAKRLVGKFTHELGKSISQTTSEAGTLQDYQSFMREYHQAMKMQRQLQALKKYAGKFALGAAGTGAAGYAAHAGYELYSGK